MPKLFGFDEPRPENGVMKKCPCGDEGPHPVTILFNGPHYAEVRCFNCSRHLGFEKKPDSDRSKRPAAHRDLVAKYSRGYCELCGIKATDCPRGFEFQAHHVDEYQAGGDPSRENIWILCKPCHDMVTVRREYVKQLLALAGKLTAWKREP